MSNTIIPTPEELGWIAGEHVDDGIGCCVTCIGWNDDGNYPLPFPCDAAKLCGLVLHQSALMIAAGLPCAYERDAKIWFSGPHEPNCDLAYCDHCHCSCKYDPAWIRYQQAERDREATKEGAGGG